MDYHDIFICYSQEDEQIASDICQKYEKDTIKCWFKKRDYIPSDSVEKIIESIRSSECMILVYSENAKKSNYVTTEIDIAFSSNIPILIFNIDNSTYEGKIEFYLKDKSVIKAFNNPEDYYEELLIATHKILDTSNIKDSYYDSYICYCDEDILLADAVCHVLEENNIKCWYKKRDFDVKDNLTKISKIIKNSKSFILINSVNARKSNYVTTEKDMADSFNIPLLSFNVNEDEKSENKSSENVHWLNAFPHPEKYFKDLVIDTSIMIENPNQNPIITEKYINMDFTPKNKEEKVIQENKKITHDFNKSYGISSKTKKILAILVIISIIVLVLVYVSTSTSYLITLTDNPNAGYISGEKYHIPEGYTLDKNESEVSYDDTGVNDIAVYNNEDGNIIIIQVNTLHYPLDVNQNDFNKKINGIDGKYNESETSFEYYPSPNKIVFLTANDESELEELLGGNPSNTSKRDNTVIDSTGISIEITDVDIDDDTGTEYAKYWNYSYFINGKISYNLDNVEGYHVNSEFYDSSGLVDSDERKLSDFKNGKEDILGSVYVDKKNINQVVVKVTDKKGDVVKEIKKEISD